MSYSMPPQQNGAPPPYPPYRAAGSPMNPPPFGPPPAKRQRLSPDPRSPPNNSPIYSQQSHGLPNVGGYGNPYHAQPVQSPYPNHGGYATSPQNSFNTPQPYPYQHMPWQTHSQPPTPASAGSPHSGMRQYSPPQQQSREMMPPPPRPNKEDREEKAGHEELGDSLFGSGVNLKEEEHYFNNVYSNSHRQGESFSTNQNTSFGSTMSQGNSFNMLTQGTSFESQDANGPFAGTLGETLSQDAVELEHRRKREAAARDQAESRQHHLNNQFLLCNNVQNRMSRLARDQGVTLNVRGMYVRQPETQVMMKEDNIAGIAAASDKLDARPAAVVDPTSSIEQALSLISLAAGERLRGLIDEAHALARARRYGDHGRVVPPDFADIAEGSGQRSEESAMPQSMTGSQWDKVPNSSADEEALPNSNSPQPQQTTSFQGNLNDRLRELAERDRIAEQARSKKREARKRAAEAAANGESVTTPTTPGEGSATTINGLGGDAGAPLKLTKKEIAKQAKEKNATNEAQSHTTTNQTAAMMALGKKGRKYNWMTGGAASIPTNRYVKPQSGSGTATPMKVEGPGSGAATPAGAGPLAVAKVSDTEVGKAPAWGEWREELVGGLEMRDWVAVLERDGREKKALELAIWKMK